MADRHTSQVCDIWWTTVIALPPPCLPDRRQRRTVVRALAPAFGMEQSGAGQTFRLEAFA